MISKTGCTRKSSSRCYLPPPPTPEMVAELPWHHRDPFDRMLIAQARAADLMLLTSDARLTAYGSFVKAV